MKLYIKKIIALLLLAILTLPLLSNVSHAAEDQFYFIARQTTEGSITQEGQQKKVVYLRWDSIEDKLPTDIVAFRLLRKINPLTPDNSVEPVILGEFPVNSVMSATQINNLYSGNDQKRRRLEIVTKLNELAASKGDAFSASNFAAYLHGLIDSSNKTSFNPLWSFLGSQTDFNIARARFRGWIDTTASTDPVEYELLAVNASGGTARLGFTRVEMGTETVLLGATKLEQIFNSTNRCDYPENAKDHFTVALNWEAPGETLSITDNFASKLYLSGFDLYRSKDNIPLTIDKAPVLDIALLASQVSTDSRGNPQIIGLEKVNQSLIIDSGTVEGEAKWLEARDLLKRSGLKPGDRRAYYLVARDFTGNYGPTIEELVEVPNTTRPPAPWNIRTFADQTSSVTDPGTFSNALLFSWDKVDLTNYMRMFQGTRKYCNTTEAQQSGILEFVGIDQDCDTDLHSSVRLDVADYRVYRFTDFDVAGRFADSDGDGVSDSIERQLGSQCNSSVKPMDAPNFLLAQPADIKLFDIAGGGLSDKPDRVRLRDKVPAGNKDTVYWYRIASVVSLPDNKERLSFLSAPQRGFFPDRTPPPEPIVEVLKPNNDSCEIIADAGQPWSFQDNTTINNPNDDNYNLSCDGIAVPLSTFISNNSVSKTSSELCQTIAYLDNIRDGCEFTLQKVGNPSCKVAVPQDVSFCESGSIEIVPGNDPVPDSELIAAEAGDEALRGVLVTVKPPNGRSCIALYEYIDGTAARIGSTCDPDGLRYQPGAGSFCGYAVATDENNNISAAVHFPCTFTPSNTKALGAPQILSFDVNETEATFTFRMPAEQAAVIMIKLDHDKGRDGNDRKITSIPAINFASGEIISQTIKAVDPLQNTKDTFCLALKAIARNSSDLSLNSSWSKQRCYTRIANGEEDVPTYLPWPTIKPATKGEELIGTSLSLFLRTAALDIIGMPLVALTDELSGKCTVLSKFNELPNDTTNSSSILEDIVCSDSGRSVIQAALKSNLNFLLYRQRRKEDLQESDWIQVSPLIEFAHFDETNPELQKKNPLYKYRLNDPFVKFFKVKNQDLYAFMYHDRYPFVANSFLGRKITTDLKPYEFRYQAVYFDKDHRPSRWRQSDWFKVVD